MRSYGETIDVRTDPLGPTGEPAAPAQFLWRGRLYLVRDVLAHWVELGTWWATPRRASPAAPSSAVLSHAVPSSVVPGVPPGAAAPASTAVPVARSVAADVGAVEREVWRVEAAPGRSGAVGVYDLVRDVPATGPGDDPARDRPALGPRWRLARALD